MIEMYNEIRGDEEMRDGVCRTNLKVPFSFPEVATSTPVD